MITLNIGMNIGDGTRKNTEREVLLVLKAYHASVLQYRVAQSNTEPTMVVQITHPLSPEKAWEIAAVLEQDCIAQDAHGALELYGPNADAWKPANRDFFIAI